MEGRFFTHRTVKIESDVNKKKKKVGFFLPPKKKISLKFYRALIEGIFFYAWIMQQIASNLNKK